MKKIAFLLLATATLLLADIKWRESFDVAQREAKKYDKPMMVLLVSHTCRWCRKLENRTLENPEVVSFVTKYFVPVLVYREDGNFPDTIHSNMVPTTFYLTPEGKNIIKPVVGYWEPMDYLSDMRLALKKFKNRAVQP